MNLKKHVAEKGRTGDHGYLARTPRSSRREAKKVMIKADKVWFSICLRSGVTTGERKVLYVRAAQQQTQLGKQAGEGERERSSDGVHEL